MPLIVDNQQPNFKYFCKICNRGFACGRALGGHMRAHGICDEACLIDDDDDIEWDDKNAPPCNKRMYSLRTNPNRLKSCRTCENCGKEFPSWKSFLSHDGKCNSEDDEFLVSSPDSDGGRGYSGSSKRKRSLRTKVGDFSSTCPSSEEEDLANCLMMLSNAIVDPLEVQPEESCASASKEDERRQPINLMFHIASRVHIDNAKSGGTKGLFECKACKKVFNSHQALGGHRASHKKVKGCFASRLDQIHDNPMVDEDVITHEDFTRSKSIKATSYYDHGFNTPIGSSSKRKSRVHECSICHRTFSSGQALGGHKRCHWVTSNSQDGPAVAKFHQFQDALIEQVQPRLDHFNNSDQSLDLNLDLNLLARKEEFACRDMVSQPGIKVSTEIRLKTWLSVDGKENEDSQHYNIQGEKGINNANNETSIYCSTLNAHDDEADSKVKLVKLNELKDVNGCGSSSPWLRVGIGSTTDME